ncbi:hypothetical protein MMC17_003978 [Xylographa soralifera]|nr:hypothetical protein [Xylographa soralifera]
MEPPLKRQWLGDSQEQLLQKRARNDLRLKSRFESIFEKFGKDFTGVGDEIDFRTGKIVVNNGHLTTMRGELDAEGLANEEDELATDTPLKLNSSQQPKRNGATLTKSQEDEDSSAQTVQEGPYGPEVSCIGSSIAAAIKMEDGSSYDSSIHGELFIARNILSQLSCLGPHIRKSIANVQRSANTSKVVSIEIEDLTVDPVWRVPVLLHPKLSTPLEESGGGQQSDPEEPRLASPERSPSPVGQSLWSLDRPVDRSTSYENVGLRDYKNNNMFLRKGRRLLRWTEEEDAMLRKLRSTTKLTSQELETHFPDRTGRALEQRWHSMKMNVIEDSQFISAKSSSPCASLPKITKPEAPAPIIESLSHTVNIPTYIATDTSAKVANSAIPPLSSHKDQNIKEGKQRRAEHARSAYQKLSLEKPLKRSQIPDIDESQFNDLQASSRDPKIVEQRISLRRTKRAKIVEIRNPAISQESPRDARDASLAEVFTPPTSSRIRRRTKASKDISQLRKARRSEKIRSPVFPVAASKSLNETKPIVDSLMKSSLADLESENNQQLPDICEPSSRDCKTNENNQLGTNEIWEMNSKEVSVVIVRQDHNNDEASSNIVETQSSEVLFRSTQYDSLTHMSSPPVRRRRSRRNMTGLQLHIGPTSLSTNRETQPEPYSEKAPLRADRDYTPASVVAHSHERKNRNSKVEKLREDLSSSPDLATIYTPQPRKNSRDLSTSKPLRESVSRKPRSKSVLSKRRTKSVSTAESPSLTSMLGEFSDDELSHTPNKGKISLSTTPTTPTLSAKARRCGLPGYKCIRTLCLTCN